MSEKVVKEPKNSTSVNNANELYNSLSDNDKALIEAMMNTVFVLLRGMQNVQQGK